MFVDNVQEFSFFNFRKFLQNPQLDDASKIIGNQIFPKISEIWMKNVIRRKSEFRPTFDF